MVKFAFQVSTTFPFQRTDKMARPRINGTTAKSISKASGHQNPASTQVYARLSIDPVREAMEAASRAMLEAPVAPPKVVPLCKVGNEGHSLVFNTIH